MQLKVHGSAGFSPLHLAALSTIGVSSGEPFGADVEAACTRAPFDSATRNSLSYALSIHRSGLAHRLVIPGRSSKVCQVLFEVFDKEALSAANDFVAFGG